jgi:hypothetical protein
VYFTYERVLNYLLVHFNRVTWKFALKDSLSSVATDFWKMLAMFQLQYCINGLRERYRLTLLSS